jgi:CRP/FNR family transcriptional regulator, cyclic AMP receptor protein
VFVKSKDVVLEHLAAVHLFRACTDNQLKLVRGLLNEVSVASGKVLVKEGSTGYECFIIVSGHVDVSIGDEVISRFSAGEYFGELALLDKRPRSATVTATTDCTVMVLSQREFAKALDTIPGLSAKLLENLALRLRDSNRRALEH